MSGFTESDRTKLTEVHTDMKHMKNSVADHETRIRFNERFTFASVAILGAITTITGLSIALKNLFMT